jgi:hypothetical protein
MRDMVEASPFEQNPEPVSDGVRWRRFGFDHAGATYGFETTCSGDRSRVVINGKAALELPKAVWFALLDAAALQRGFVGGGPAFAGGPVQDGRSPADLVGLPVVAPAAAGSAWDAVEDEQLRSAWIGGSSVAELAVLHQRSRGAITSRLSRLGLAIPGQTRADVAATEHADAKTPVDHSAAH